MVDELLFQKTFEVFHGWFRVSFGWALCFFYVWIVFSRCLLHRAGGLIFPVGVLVVSFSRFGLGWVPCGSLPVEHQEPAKGSAAPSHSGAMG